MGNTVKLNFHLRKISLLPLNDHIKLRNELEFVVAIFGEVMRIQSSIH